MMSEQQLRQALDLFIPSGDEVERLLGRAPASGGHQDLLYAMLLIAKEWDKRRKAPPPRWRGNAPVPA